MAGLKREGAMRNRLNSRGIADGFLVRHGPSGDFEWVEHVGGSDNDWVEDVVALPDGSVYVSGSFGEQASFGRGSLVAKGMFDLFLAHYAPDGELQWVKQAGAQPRYAYGFEVAATPDGTAYVGGAFDGVLPFGDTTLSSVGGWDTFLAKCVPNGGGCGK